MVAVRSPADEQVMRPNFPKPVTSRGDIALEVARMFSFCIIRTDSGLSRRLADKFLLDNFPPDIFQVMELVFFKTFGNLFPKDFVWGKVAPPQELVHPGSCPGGTCLVWNLFFPQPIFPTETERYIFPNFWLVCFSTDDDDANFWCNVYLWNQRCDLIFETSQELRLLSSVTINCQVTNIVMNVKMAKAIVWIVKIVVNCKKLSKL